MSCHVMLCQSVSMYVCIYVCMYVCMLKYEYIDACTNTQTHTHTSLVNHNMYVTVCMQVKKKYINRFK